MEKLQKEVRVAVEGHKHLMQQSFFAFHTLQKFLQERGNTGHTVVLCSLELEELNDCKEIQTIIGGHGAWKDLDWELLKTWMLGTGDTTSKTHAK